MEHIKKFSRWRASYCRLMISLMISIVLLVAKKVASKMSDDHGGIEYVVIGPEFSESACYGRSPGTPYRRNVFKEIEPSFSSALREYCRLHFQITKYVAENSKKENISYSNYWPFLATDALGLQELGCTSDLLTAKEEKEFALNVCTRLQTVHSKYPYKIHSYMQRNTLAALTRYATMNMRDPSLEFSQSYREAILKGPDPLSNLFEYVPRFTRHDYKIKVVIPIVDIGYNEIAQYNNELLHMFAGGIPVHAAQKFNFSIKQLITEKMAPDGETVNKELPISFDTENVASRLNFCTKNGTTVRNLENFADGSNTHVNYKEAFPSCSWRDKNVSSPTHLNKPSRLSNVHINDAYFSMREVIEDSFNETNVILVPLQFGCRSVLDTTIKPVYRYYKLNKKISECMHPQDYVANKINKTIDIGALKVITPFKAVFGLQSRTYHTEMTLGYNPKTHPNLFKYDKQYYTSFLDASYGVDSYISKAVSLGKSIIPVCVMLEEEEPFDFSILRKPITRAIKRLFGDKIASGVHNRHDTYNKEPATFSYAIKPFVTRHVLSNISRSSKLPVDVLGMSLLIKREYARDLKLFEASPYFTEFIAGVIKHFYTVMESIVSAWNNYDYNSEFIKNSVVSPKKLYYKHALVIPNESLTGMATFFSSVSSRRCNSVVLVITADVVQKVVADRRKPLYMYIPKIYYIDNSCNTKLDYRVGDIMSNCTTNPEGLGPMGVVSDPSLIVHVDVLNLSQKDILNLDSYINHKVNSITPDNEKNIISTAGLQGLRCPKTTPYKRLSNLKLGYLYRQLDNYKLDSLKYHNIVDNAKVYCLYKNVANAIPSALFDDSSLNFTD